MNTGVSLYIHIPFCRKRCHYCDFFSTVDDDCKKEVLEKILFHSLKLAGRFDVENFSTVYIGGGTPSSLDGEQLRRLVKGLPGIDPARTIEFSIEANPEDLTVDFLSLLSDLGINRLSLGIQSLEEQALKEAGRNTDRDRSLKAIELVSKSWQQRWSADFIYGLPGQSERGLADNISFLLDAGAGHISLYELGLSEGTALDASVRNGKIELPDEDAAFAQFDAAREILTSRGLIRYEVSNWARPGHECIHNLNYWMMGDWLATGPSASGNIRMDSGFLRMEAPAEINKYLENPLGGKEYSVEGRDAFFETIMMGLRQSRGVDMNALAKRFGKELAADAVSIFSRFPWAIVQEGNIARPSEEGMDKLNPVLLACLEPDGPLTEKK